jgi:plastocyanin
MTRLPALALSIALLTCAVAACGGSSSKSTASPPTSPSPASSTPSGGSTQGSAAATGTLALAANPGGALKFTKTSLTAKAGTVKIAFTNNAPLAHNVTVRKGTTGPVIGATPTFIGGTKTLTLNLKPGTYTYFCSVPGHREGGMQGTLTVK